MKIFLEVHLSLIGFLPALQKRGAEKKVISSLSLVTFAGYI